jgi:cardiolipin synthase
MISGTRSTELKRRVLGNEPLPPLEVCGQTATLFTQPVSLMEAMLADFRAARSRIWVESYIIRWDWIGREMARVLRQRAAEGLDVRLLYDSIGCLSVWPGYFHRLRRSGVQVHGFHPWWKLLPNMDLRTMNIRDHRRLVIVDDEIGYFGGMNIGDFGGPGSKRPRFSRRSAVEATWPDVHMRMVGPRQADLEAGFESLWRRARGESPAPAPPWQFEELDSASEETICFFDSDPRDPMRRPENVFVPLFRRARESITLLVSYSLPLGPVLDELIAACRRGVRVRLVLPADSDIKIVQYAARHFYEELHSYGIEIYEREGQMLHSKTMVIDGEWCVVGSCNLDPRSLWINLEFFAVIRSRAMGTLLEEIASAELSQSRRVDQQRIAGRRWWQRLVDSFAWKFRRWI